MPTSQEVLIETLTSRSEDVRSPPQKFHFSRQEQLHWLHRFPQPQGPVRKLTSSSSLSDVDVGDVNGGVVNGDVDGAVDGDVDVGDVDDDVSDSDGILWTYLHFGLVLKQAADIGEDGKGNYCGQPKQWGTPGYRHLRPGTGRTSKKKGQNKQTWETGVKTGQLILVNPCDILLPWYHHRSGFSFMILMIIMMMIIIKFLKALTSWLRWNVPLQEPAQWRGTLRQYYSHDHDHDVDIDGDVKYDKIWHFCWCRWQW